MQETILRVDSVSKKFCRDLKSNMKYGARDLLKASFGIMDKNPRLLPKEFWALKDLNFELKRGEALGVLGQNGAGKTTLLKLIAGICPPDSGRIEIHGKVTALLALGAGFHPLMSGRENIFLNGSILGLDSQYIKKNFDSIVDFAEIEAVLDAPVYTYSSGMKLRLGFSIATISSPDLLLLDECLAVGDAKFQNKCHARLAAMKENTAIIFTSHSMMGLKKICDFGLLLNKESSADFGAIEAMTQKYGN